EIYEAAMRPHRERQQQLEEQVKSLQLSPASRDTALKLESELQEVKVNNDSPIVTAKSHVVGTVVPGNAIKPPVWRRAASWGLAAGLICVFVALVVGHKQGGAGRSANG